MDTKFDLNQLTLNSLIKQQSVGIFAKKAFSGATKKRKIIIPYTLSQIKNL